MKKQTIILLLILTSTIQVIPQQTVERSITINLDKKIVNPGDNILFVVATENFNSSITLEVNYNNWSVFTTDLINVTQEGKTHLWKVPGFSTNGTYTVKATSKLYPAISTNTTFEIIREDFSLIVLHKYYPLVANVSFTNPAGQMEKEWNANVTNLYSNHSINVFVEDYFLILPFPEKSLNYEIGNPVKIEAQNQRWVGEKIFVAGIYKITGQIEGQIKREVTNTILTIAYVIVVVIVFTYVVYRSKDSLTSSRIGQKKRVDISKEDFERSY